VFGDFETEEVLAAGFGRRDSERGVAASAIGGSRVRDETY
jgi:hypothetical protein